MMNWYIDPDWKTNWFNDPLVDDYQTTPYYRHIFTRDYTIKNDTIYFKNVVILNIKNYYKILDVVEKIVFDDEIFRCSNGLFLPKSNITHITFGEKFKQPFVLTRYLVCVQFIGYFNQKLVMSSALERIFIGPYFTQSIVLGKNIRVMNIIGCSNVPFKLNKKIKYLAYGKGRSHIFSSGLSKNLKYYVSNAIYEQRTILPKHLIYLDFRSVIGAGTFILPSYIKYLVVHCYHHYNYFDTKGLTSNNLHLCIVRPSNAIVMDNLPNGLKSINVLFSGGDEFCNVPNDKVFIK